LENERDDTAGYVATNRASTAMRTTVKADQAKTNATLAQISSEASGVNNDGGYQQQTMLDLENGVVSAINDLPQIRTAALTTKYPAVAVIDDYDTRIVAFDTFSNDIASGSGNPALQSDVTVLNALLRMEDDASLQRAFLYQALAATP